MKQYIKWCITAALGVLFLYFVSIIFQNMMDFQWIYSGWSTRYHSSISEIQKNSARRYCVDNSESMNGIWPAFWTESKMELKADSVRTDAPCLLYDGDCSVVWPVTFKSGGYPGELDEKGCAISTQLSWRLWGSLDTVGKEIEMDGRQLVVRGVYESEEITAIIKGTASTAMNNVDWMTKEPVIRETLTGYLDNIGLGKPDSIVDGNGLTGLMSMLSWIPIIFAGMVTLVTCVAVTIGRVNPAWKKWILMGALLIFSLCLPWFLSRLPVWLLPTKWSDFSFWTDLFQKLEKYVKEWFALYPTTRDVYAKQLLLEQSFLVLISLVSLGLFYRFAGKLGKKQKTTRHFKYTDSSKIAKSEQR